VSYLRNIPRVPALAFLAVLAGALSPVRAQFAELLSASPGPLDFVLAAQGRAAPIYVDGREPQAVQRAAGDLAADVERVTGIKPNVVHGNDPPSGEIVMIGSLGHGALIDKLAAAGKLDIGGIQGEWESAVIQVVRDPLPGVAKALVIAGSDRRGAIYGVYGISESIGVSPWYWWADVPVKRRNSVGISGGAHKLYSPAVKYRGIFLNDEDWGLRPWASRTLDPQTGNIGPKTYARIFELLLRLRGNYLWPAMHPGTRAFDSYPENKVLADDYGVVMGSSHAEPMLRNNVDEWTRDGIGDYNYETNHANVLRYWEKRLQSNAAYENVYTLGMRGIHDGPMAGGGTLEEQADRLRRVISDQRELLGRYVDSDLARVPQLFCPYKEVLSIYRRTPEIVPDNVTLLWPDDDYGYIQHFSDAVEQRRSGGSGVYYHISYWGRPYDYLWLCSTPPALIGEEMTKAWRTGARRVWVVNVGDIKPAESDTEFFLRLAWNPDLWRPSDGQHAFFRESATRDFGPEHSEEIASILDSYYTLNFQRKPEHVGIDPANRVLAQPAFSPVANGDEAQRRLDAFAALRARADALAGRLGREYADAFYQWVLYPVRAAELMNRKWLSLAKFDAFTEQGRATAAQSLKEAENAQAAIDRETRFYNEEMSGGRWKGMMSATPREQTVFGFPRRIVSAVPPGASLGVEPENQSVRFPAKETTAILRLPEFNPLVPQRHFIDVFDGGRSELVWEAKPSADWILLSKAAGHGDDRIFVTIDWKKAPRAEKAEGNIGFSGAGRTVDVTVAIRNPMDISQGRRADFAETDGRLVLSASDTSGRKPGEKTRWETVNGIGYAGESVAAISLDATPKGTKPSMGPETPGKGAELDYTVWIETPGEWRLVSRSLPTWPLRSGQPVRYAVALDNGAPHVIVIRGYQDEMDPQWQEDVLRNAVFTASTHALSRGMHVLRVWAVDPGIVLDAFMLERPGCPDAGYLWPDETRVTEHSPSANP